MAFEFLNGIYFGNPILSWIMFFAIIIVFVVIAKTIIFVTKTHGRKITAKSKSDLDDKLLDMIEEPVAFVMVIIGLFIGYQFLTFSQQIDFYFVNIIKLLGIIGITWVVISLVDVLLEKFLKPAIGKTKTKYDDQIVQVLSKVVKVIIIVFALIVILDSFGIDVFTLVAGLGIGGLAIAFAAKETIADIFGGMSILISRPFVLGDLIDSNGVVGKVEEISIRHTRIRNLDKRLVSIPNSKIAGSVITNITSAPKRKTVWKIGVTYDTKVAKIEQAKEIITNAIKSCKLCENDPKVAFDEFNSYSLDILVVFFTKTGAWADMVQAKDEVGLKIKKEFEKARIQFAYPTQTIHLEK